MLRQHPELFRGVSEKANPAAATGTVLAWLGTVPCRMKPALKNSMSELA